MTPPVAEPDKPAKPGVLDRLRARYAWFDHVMRAQERYQDSKGDFYAAGITYFTVFAIFPLLMVGFAIGGFVLVESARPARRDRGENQVDCVGRLRPAAGESDGVGDRVAYLGRHHRLGHRRMGGAGLDGESAGGADQMWGLMRHDPPGFVRTKLSDLIAMMGFFAAIVVTIALTALGNAGPDEACAGMAWAARCSGRQPGICGWCRC